MLAPLGSGAVIQLEGVALQRLEPSGVGFTSTLLFCLFSLCSVVPKTAYIESLCSRTAALVLLDLVESRSEQGRGEVERVQPAAEAW